MNIYFLLSFFFYLGHCIVVEIPGQGKVRGSEEFTFPLKSKKIYTFRGVPYGRDTSGDRRFLPSEEAEPWSGILDVTTFMPNQSCPQISFLGYQGTEDCLKLYIFTPQLPSSSNFTSYFPVLFWIHGGSFTSGDSSFYEGTRLLDVADIVLVVIHYRLGTLGFLCTHTDSAPCNAGLSDQVLALEYVHKYISVFGGDRNRVVIAGESAGAASVSHLMLYDKAADLFHGVIAESGTALESWALDSTPVESAFKFGSYVNCGFSNLAADELVACLKQIDAETLVKAWKQFSREQQLNGSLGFSGAIPAIQIVGERKIITEKPLDKLARGNFTKVPMLIGSNSHEGSFVLAELYKNFVQPHNLGYDQDFWKNDSLRLILKCVDIEDESGAIEEFLLQQYFNGEYPYNITDANAPFIDMLGVLFFKRSIHLTASLVHDHGVDAYVYSFEHEGVSAFNLFFGNEIPIYQGVSHSDELHYIFRILPLETDVDKQMSTKMVKIWTNFVQFLNVSGNSKGDIPYVSPYSSEDRKYIQLKLPLSVKSDYVASWRPCMGVNGNSNYCIP